MYAGQANGPVEVAKGNEAVGESGMAQDADEEEKKAAPSKKIVKKFYKLIHKKQEDGTITTRKVEITDPREVGHCRYRMTFIFRESENCPVK